VDGDVGNDTKKNHRQSDACGNGPERRVPATTPVSNSLALWHSRTIARDPTPFWRSVSETRPARGFERADQIEGLSPQSVAGYRALREAIDGSGLVDAGEDLVARLTGFLDRVAYRDEVTRLYDDPMAREARWAGVLEILNFAEKHVKRSAKPTLDGFLEELALTSGDGPEEKPDARRNAVTLHAAKGLEFPHVFLVGMEEGLFPHERAAKEGAIEEERRLAHVGITRAMTNLTLTAVSSFTVEKPRRMWLRTRAALQAISSASS
jgi:superfamily I DNA/RNA helicase